MRFFFYGTLRDPALLEVVLARPLVARRSTSAWLPGHSCRGVVGETYPCLAPAPGAHVEGLLVDGLTARDAVRIAFYEGAEYRMANLLVRRAGGGAVLARTCLARTPLFDDGAPWDFETWRRHHLDHQLRRAKRWMREGAMVRPSALDGRWRRLGVEARRLEFAS